MQIFWTHFVLNVCLLLFSVKNFAKLQEINEAPRDQHLPNPMEAKEFPGQVRLNLEMNPWISFASCIGAIDGHIAINRTKNWTKAQSPSKSDRLDLKFWSWDRLVMIFLYSNFRKRKLILIWMLRKQKRLLSKFKLHLEVIKLGKKCQMRKMRWVPCHLMAPSANQMLKLSTNQKAFWKNHFKRPLNQVVPFSFLIGWTCFLTFLMAESNFRNM